MRLFGSGNPARRQRPCHDLHQNSPGQREKLPGKHQVHAIEAVKRASANQESGFVWHTTGSGKTLTSYTVAKNLILIPNIDKTIFLIDRKDLDQQTSLSFKAYAENDIIDVDETDNTHDLLTKLRNKDRVVIVTTIQKLQIMISRRLKETHRKYQKIKGQTYEAILTTTSIKKAQEYYDLLKKVVAGETPIQINEEIRKVLPDLVSWREVGLNEMEWVSVSLFLACSRSSSAHVSTCS